MASSNFFLPLTGKEDTQRLEVKYRSYLESDEEDDMDQNSQKESKGKVSEWTFDDKATTSQWLRSPSKKDSNYTGNLHKKHPPRGTRVRRTLQSPNCSKAKFAKNKDSPIEVKSNKGFLGHKEGGAKQCIEKVSTYDHQSIDDGTDDNDEDHQSNDRSKSKSKKRIDIKGTSPKNTNFISEGFSAEDTERPKLSVRPTAAKIDFLLSLDGEEPVVKVPGCMNQYLRDYQRDGIKFLYQHYIQGKGAILGDDMGLGKTVQVIGFLSALLGKQGNHRDTIRALPKFIRELSDEITDSPPRAATKPFLIVGPACVMINWLEELKTWGYFTAGKFHGGDKELCLADVKKGKLEVVVTTFETFRDSVDRLCEIEWESIIVDEVHKMKEPRAQVSKALNQIPTLCRYGLTGTALQNHMVDLWSIMDWAQPGILGSLEKFNHKFTFAIEMGQRHDASKRDLALARKQKDKFAEIRKRLMLRRTKALIADQLPSKEDNVVMCRLTDFQVSVYKAILNHPHTALILQAEDPCDCGKKKLKASCCYKYAPGKIKVWSLVLSFMHLLLKAANHCALLIPDGSGKTSQWQAKLAQEVCTEALKDFPQFVQQTRDAAFLTLSDPSYCGKMKILQGLLTVFSSSHDKVLVFSYSTRLLDIVEQYVIGQCYGYRRIDGKTSSQKRMDIVHQFNKDSDIFLCLISTKAGGLGLNLTGANRVVIFDPNWNPSHDLQAQDRAYRIGQTRSVKVYRLVSAGTIEENIYLRQVYKQQLDEVAVGTSNAKRYFHGIQGDKWSRGELFGVKNMFNLRTSDTCMTMDILKRNERLEKDLAGYDITRYIPPSVETESLDDDDDDDVDDSSDNASDSVEEPREKKEEDETLLDTLFGKDRVLNKDLHKSIASHPSATGGGETSASVQGGGGDSNDDSDEDDDFFLPKIRHRSNLEGKKDSPEERSSKKYMLTVEDITFSSSTGNAVRTQHNPEKFNKARSRLNNWKPSPGLSWLFSPNDDSDEEEGNESKVKEDGERSKDDDLYERRSLGKTASILSQLFPDSDDEIVSENQRNGLYCDDDVEPNQEKELRSRRNISPHKRKAKIIEKPTEDEPSTSRVRQTKGTSRRKKQQKFDAGKSDFDSVKAVFEECGVLHIHGNKEVIGSSRAEDHMTRCAMQEVFEMKTNTQMPAMQCDPLPQESEEEPKIKKRKGKKDPPDHNAPSSTKVGSVKLLLGQTPPGVQRQVWPELCKFMKEDQLVLAQRIISCTQEKRLEMLRGFYTQKHPKLGPTLDTLLRVKSPDEVATPIQEQPPKGTKSSNSERERTGASSSKTTHDKNVGTYKPTSSKSKSNLRRPLPSTLIGHTLMDSESQDSLTAHSPPTDHSLSSDNEDEKFTPAPPKQKSRRVTPSKSGTTTRLRQKALNETARVKLFKKPSDKRGVAFDGSGDECVGDNDAVDTSSLYVTQTTEDIPSLLCELGSRTSKRLNHRDSASAKNVPMLDSYKGSTTNINVLNTETEAYNISPSVVTSFQTKANNISTKRPLNPRRDYASILDDIFDDKTAELVDDGSKEENRSDCGVPNPEKLHSKRAIPDLECNDNMPSTSGCSTRHATNPGSSSVCEVVESDGIVEDSDDFSEVDDLFLTSTLKEDKSESSSRRRKGLTSPGKGKRRRQGLSPRKRMEMDSINDNGSHSQSLFS